MADSDHQSTHSAILIGSNSDLLTEILHRLPIISIVRFKSVSKHWLSLLSHHHFTKLYDNGSISTGLFVKNLYIPFDVENRNPPPFSLLDLNHRGIKIVQSCNGLLLCCKDRDYYIFNPTTMQSAIIPPVPGGIDVHKTIRFMGLAFHQTDCVHYKVICIHREDVYDQRLQVQVYSSDSRKWKKTSKDSYWASYYTPFSGQVYWNGAIHWAPSCYDPMYFKLDVEQLQILPLPSPFPVRVEDSYGYTDGFRPLYFGESRGHLHLVETASHENYLDLIVYEMLSDHSGWFVKYLVELDDLRAVYPDMTQIHQHPSRPFYYEFEVLDIVRGDEKDEKDEEDTFMVISVSKKIIRYNILDKSFEEIFDLTNTSHGRIGPWEVYRYTKTITTF